MKPRISVLMPVYNSQKYIEESIQSILNQTYAEFELIVLDDCSTDKTQNILQSLQKKDSRISVFQNSKNMYIARARNLLLGYAHGEYIAWQDADDIAYPSRLELQMNYLDTHKEVGIVGGFLAFYNGHKVTSIREYYADDKRLRRDMFRYSPVAQPAAMIRMECFQKVGLYDERYPPAEDIDMSFRIGAYYQFANIQTPLIKYRVSSDSATHQRLSKMRNSTFEIRFRNRSNMAYHLRYSDVIYNLLQLILSYTLPDRLQILLFNLFRNSKLRRTYEN